MSILYAKMLYFGFSFPKALSNSWGHLMKRSIGVSLVLVTLFGCSSMPSGPVLPDGRAKVSLNSPSTVAQTMADYYRAQADKKAKLEPARAMVRVTISQIIERYMPSDFRVYAGEGVDLETFVDYEASRPWFEAIGKPLSDVGIEMTAHLEHKTMMLRVGSTTIEQVLNRAVPADYTVYADEAVRLDQPIKLDRSRPWMEALGKALAGVGVAMTANVDRKMIVLKPKATSKIIRFKDDGSFAAQPPGGQSYPGVAQRGINASNPSNN